MIQYRIATHADLSAVARTHQACFPGTFISSFGNRLIQNYYKEYIEEDNLFVVAIEDNEIIGFCMGYRTVSQARNHFIKKNCLGLMIRIAWFAMTFNKFAISKCVSYLKPKKRTEALKKKAAKGDLLSICVMDECKGTGISVKLISEFEDLLRKKGIADYTLTVYKTNERAIRFYEKCGLTFYEAKEDEIKMYKKI